MSSCGFPGPCSPGRGRHSDYCPPGSAAPVHIQLECDHPLLVRQQGQRSLGHRGAHARTRQRYLPPGAIFRLPGRTNLSPSITKIEWLPMRGSRSVRARPTPARAARARTTFPCSEHPCRQGCCPRCEAWPCARKSFIQRAFHVAGSPGAYAWCTFLYTTRRTHDIPVKGYY